LTFGFAFFSFLANIFFQNPIVFDYLNVEEYLFFTPLIYIVCSANNGIFLKKIIRFTSKWSIFLFLISVVIFLNRGYEFSLVPNVLYRFNLEVKGNLFGPIILLGFFPVTLFSLVINKSFKINFSCLFLVLGILFILYFGYLTLTRSLVFVLFYFVSFILLYTNKYFRLIIYPIVLSSIYWLVNLVISLRVEEQDFSSGRNDELIEFYNYLDSNQIFYFVPKLFGFTKKSLNNDFIGSQKMMHSGFFHLVLQFGFIISIIIFGFLVYSVVKYYINNQRFEFICLLNFLLVSFIGTLWFSEVDMILLFSIIGAKGVSFK
jgi:hypothetical protein